jgi:hypothetical protein
MCIRGRVKHRESGILPLLDITITTSLLILFVLLFLYSNRTRITSRFITSTSSRIHIATMPAKKKETDASAAEPRRSSRVASQPAKPVAEVKTKAPKKAPASKVCAVDMGMMKKR